MQLTDEVNEIINNNAPKSLAKIVDDFISQDDKLAMEEGVRYYKTDHDIEDKKRTYWHEGEEVEDETKPNNKLAHAWHTILVDQKANYLVGTPVTFSDKEVKTDVDGNRQSPNQEFIAAIKQFLGEQFDDVLNDLVVGASNKGVEYLHLYVTENGDFDYKVIDARQVIPIWGTSEQKELEAVIRYYVVQINDDYRIKAEFWTPDMVRFFVEDEGGSMVLDTITEDQPEDSHFYYGKNGYGWGQVPFIPFKNNKHMTGDLNQYKSLIDDYDEKNSVRADDLDEIQEAVDVLKNYQGQSLDEYQHNKRYFKAIKVGRDGDVDQLTIDLPTEAHKEHLDRLEENIITFGQGVDPKTDEFGGNASGVSLKFLYSLLDLKADKTERKFQRAFRKLFWFIAEYLSISEGVDYDPQVVKVKFDRSMIANEKEKVEMANKSKGVISDKIVLENHPWVDDSDKELGRIRQENKDKVNLE
jgi:SPP1 family phage portal protein